MILDGCDDGCDNGIISQYATSATLSTPNGLAYDSANSILFISDTGNSRILKVAPNNGAVSTYGTGITALNPGYYTNPQKMP